MSQVLSQSEVDALLSAVSDNRVDADDEGATKPPNQSMPSTAHYIEIRSVPQHREAKMKIRKSCCKTELQSS